MFPSSLANPGACYAPHLCVPQHTTLHILKSHKPFMSLVFTFSKESDICGYYDNYLNAIQAMNTGRMVMHHPSKT